MKKKRKLGRKLLSFLLTLAMVVGLVPGMSLTAYAEYVCPLCGSTNIFYNEEECEWFCSGCMMPFATPAESDGSQNNGVCPHCGSTDYEKWEDDDYYSCNSCGDWFVAPVEEVADDSSRIGSVYHTGDTLPKAFYYDDYDDAAVFLKQELAIYELRGCVVDVDDVNALIFPYRKHCYLYFRSETARATDAVTAVKISSGGGSRENPYQLTPQYPVSFNANGGSPAPSAQQVWRGDEVTAPAAPTREGCEFAGWFNVNTQWDFNQNSVDYPITLTAHWNVPVTSVSLPDTATLTVDGEAVALTATVEPAEATDKTVKWSTTGGVTLYSDENCTAGNEIGADATSTLTVWAKGMSAGSATVTCTSNADSSKSASCDVTVNEAAAPTGAYASYVNTTTSVKFNDLDWYIIADNSTAIDAGTVTLFAKDSIAKSKFNENGSDGNAYNGSEVKGAVDALTAAGGSFADVADAIMSVDLTDVNVSGAKLYLLSTDEANALPLELREFSDYWWLRSAGTNGDEYAACVNQQGTVRDYGSKVTFEDSVRPALQLDLSKVTFDSTSNTFSVVSSTVAVTGVTLNPSAAQTIDVNGTVSFTATVEPSDATDKTVKWSVGGTNAGAVKLYTDEDCTTEVGAEATETLTVWAKGISAGSATVTCTSNADSTKSASCDVTVNEAVSDNPYASLLNTTTVVKFDNKDWYLIENNSTAANAGTVTLLAKECVAASQYNSSGSYVEYASSTVKTAVDNWYDDNITSNAKTAVVDNKMFLLTKEQANTMTGDTRKCSKASGADATYWWLCSRGNNALNAAFVYGGSGRVSDGGYRVDYTLGVRPALKLDLSKVSFDSTSNTFATAAPALDPVPYMAWDETSKTVKDVEGGCTDYTVVTDSTAAFEDGKWYVVNGEVSVASRITVTGTTNIILCDGAKLNANEGIALTSGKTLNIYGQSNGTGELTACGGENIAGIGGGNKEHAGNVTIHGGVVYATGGTNGAGIGGGNEGNGGNVTINGGKVYATGGTNGAGIGGGNYANGGIVTVNGGTVDAKTIGNTSATSIGYGKYKSNAGSLIVASTHVAYSSDSPITAANKTSATAVQGSGAAMNIARQHYMLVEEGTLPLDPVSYLAWDGEKLVEKKDDDACKEYTVVTADTTEFADGGWYVVKPGESAVEIINRIKVVGTAHLILMDGATLNAQKGITVNENKTLNIYAQSTDTAGTLTADNSGAGYAAIGGSSNNSGGTVNIHGGKITANGGNYAAGIGGGQEGDGGSVAIYGGSVTTNGGSGAMGIGKGNEGSRNGNLTLGTGVGMIVSTDNTNWSAYTGSNRAQYMKTGVAHTHDFTYSADGATITATCGAEGCDLTDSKATLTIVAPTMTVYQETGKSEAATLTGLQDFNTATGKSLAVTNIMYVGRDGTEYTESTTAPTNGGKYTATITLSGVKTAEGENKSVAASVDYSIKYSVTFNTNGGSAVPQQLVEAGESATRPTDPTKEGNIFGGWFADADFANSYVFDEVTENTTVYAKWGEHRVTWTVGGYSIHDVFTGNAPAADSNETVNSVTNMLKPEGATFEGWKTETDESGDVTYTAQFSFPVTLNVNGGTINAGNVESYIYGTGATLPTDVTRAKYDFGGWFDNSEFTGTAVTQIGTTEVGSKEFWAKWTEVYAVPATVTANSRTYDGTEKPLVAVTGTATGGTMQYALGTATEATEPYTTSIPARTNAGTYYVWYKVKADANHMDTDPNHVSVTIAKKTLTITAGDQTIEHDGEIATGTDLAMAVTLAQGDTLTAVTLTPGEGKITPSAAKIMNGQTDRTECYEITYVDGALTVNPAPAPAPAPSGGGSSTPATVTIPVSSEDGKTSVNVTVQVSGSTATVTSANVDEVLKAKDVGNVTVNVDSLNKTVDEVVLPAALVEKVAKAVADNGNDASGLEIKLPTGTVTFDATTVATLAKQSDGKDLKVHLDKVPTASLTPSQQNAVKDVNALVVLDAYVTSDGKRISNFNGGKATFSVPVELKDGQVPEGVAAFFVDDNGDMTEIPCSCDGKTATGTVEHFSNYVVTYDESRVTKPEPEPQPEPEPTPGPATPTDIGYDDLSETEKKDADTVSSALGVDKDTAAQMVKTATELGVSIDTVKLSGAALAKMNVDSSDPKGADFGKLTARVTKRTNSALTLKWKKQKNADGYLIYGNKCGKGNKMKLIKTVKKNKTVSYTQKKLKKGTYYKYMVVAYKNVNGQKMPIAASVVLHAPTKGGKLTVAKSVKVNKTKVSVKKGKSVTLKATEVLEEKKLKAKTHRVVKFESSNPKIAKVNAKGKITGKKKGTCTVWAYAQNGIFKAIQVTVK